MGVGEGVDRGEREGEDGTRRRARRRRKGEGVVRSIVNLDAPPIMAVEQGWTMGFNWKLWIVTLDRVY